MITITPGQMSLVDWRAVHDGASVTLNRQARPVIEAGAQAVERILAKGEAVYGINTGFGKLASVRISESDLGTLQRNLVLSHATGLGAPLADDIVRLIMALKMASLARGASGVRWATVWLLEQMLERGVLPLIPGQGSVGASGDLAPLAHLAAVMIGHGEARVNGKVKPAVEALHDAGLEPVTLGPKEGLALLNGTQVSTAIALSALFKTETLFASALVTGAMSTDAAKGSDTPFDARIHELRGHKGQKLVAAELRRLLAGSPLRQSHLEGDDRVQDPYCLRCQPQVMGAAFDIIRNAAFTLETEANAVSDNPLVFADTGEVLSGGNFHAEPVAFAADILALAIAEIGNLAERRIALLVDPNISLLPAFLAPKPGLNSGFMIAQVTAAALASENKQRAAPGSIDTIPTSANQEDHVSMATHSARRLHDMAENLAGILGVEALQAAQGLDLRAPILSSQPIEAAKKAVRKVSAFVDEDRFLAPDMAAGQQLIVSGALPQAAGLDAAALFLCGKEQP